MITTQPAAQMSRPIRALIHPETETPLSGRHAPERRQHPRYSRCLIGTMTAGEQQYSIACVDVSAGGAQVVVPGTPAVNRGDRVGVRIDHHSGTYKDEFTVVQLDGIASGTAVHLKL